MGLLFPRQQNHSPRPSESVGDPTRQHGGLPGWAWFLIAVAVVLILLAVAYFAWLRVRKQRLGPATRNYPARGGVVGWLQGKLRTRGYRRAGRARGAGAGAGGGGSGIDDDVWNTRLANETDDFGTRYDDDSHLGLHGSGTEPYSAGGYGHIDTGYGPAQGLGVISTRGSERGIDRPYDEDTSRHQQHNDPFDEQHAEPSDFRGGYRSISPIPHDDEHDHHSTAQRPGDSPTERRSMFKESI